MGSGGRFQADEGMWFGMYQVIDLENFLSKGVVDVGCVLVFKGRQ